MGLISHPFFNTFYIMEIEVIKDLTAYAKGNHKVTKERGNYLIMVGAAKLAKSKKEDTAKPEKKK